VATNENNTVRIAVGGNGRIGPEKSSQPKSDFASSQIRTGEDLRMGKAVQGLSKGKRK
jgi:exosome complex RNA-binding protein Rrp4